MILCSTQSNNSFGRHGLSTIMNLTVNTTELLQKTVELNASSHNSSTLEPLHHQTHQPKSPTTLNPVHPEVDKANTLIQPSAVARLLPNDVPKVTRKCNHPSNLAPRPPAGSTSTTPPTPLPTTASQRPTRSEWLCSLASWPRAPTSRRGTAARGCADGAVG